MNKNFLAQNFAFPKRMFQQSSFIRKTYKNISTITENRKCMNLNLRHRHKLKFIFFQKKQKKNYLKYNNNIINFNLHIQQCKK